MEIKKYFIFLFLVTSVMCKDDISTIEMVEVSLEKKISNFLIKLTNEKTINYYSNFYNFIVIKEVDKELFLISIENTEDKIKNIVNKLSKESDVEYIEADILKKVFQEPLAN
jgi:hypothetical protein